MDLAVVGIRADIEFQIRVHAINFDQAFAWRHQRLSNELTGLNLLPNAAREFVPTVGGLGTVTGDRLEKEAAAHGRGSGDRPLVAIGALGHFEPNLLQCRDIGAEVAPGRRTVTAVNDESLPAEFGDDAAHRHGVYANDGRHVLDA